MMGFINQTSVATRIKVFQYLPVLPRLMRTKIVTLIYTYKEKKLFKKVSMNAGLGYKPSCQHCII